MKLGWYWKPFSPSTPQQLILLLCSTGCCLIVYFSCGLWLFFLWLSFITSMLFDKASASLYSSNPDYIKMFLLPPSAELRAVLMNFMVFLNKSLFHLIYLFFSSATAIKVRATEVVFLLSLSWQSPSKLTNMMKSESLPGGCFFQCICVW